MAGSSGETPPSGALTGLLSLVTRAQMRRPGSALWLMLISAVLGVGLAARFLTFKTSRSDLIDPRAPFQQRWLQFVERFGDQSDLVIVIESPDPRVVTAALDRLGMQLREQPELFQRVSWKFDPGPLLRKGLQYLSPAELEQGLKQLTIYGPILEGHWDRAGLESYCRRLTSHLRWTEQNGRAAEMAATLSQAVRLSESLTSFAALAISPSRGGVGSAGMSGVPDRAAAGFLSPWPEVFPLARGRLESLRAVRYQSTPDGTMGFLTAVPIQSPEDFSGSSPAIERIRTLLAAATQEFPQATFGLTGIPVLEADEMHRSQMDMGRASLISLGGVAVLLLVGFRGVRHPVIALVMLLVGLSWSIGYTTVTVGHLNILSVSFAAILIGLGIDCAIHYLAKYLELRRNGGDLDETIVRTSESVGTGIATAAITTALAFLCAAFTQFLGVAELGIIAGGGIVLCAAAAFLVLPPLLKIADRRVEPRQLPTPFRAEWLRRLTARRPLLLTGLSLILVVAVGAGAIDWRQGGWGFRVRYDANLLNLQADDVESVAVQQRIFRQSGASLLYAVSLASSPGEARRRAEQFEALPTVAHVEHLATAMPPYPPSETQLLVQAIRARLAQLSAIPRDLPQIDPLTIGQALEELLTVLEASGDPAVRAAAARLDAFLDGFEKLPVERQVEFLESYQYAMLTALRTELEHIAAAADPAPVTVDDLDSAIRDRFVSPQGDWLLRVFPREQVWDEAPLARFVADVRSIDPEATGTPLQNFEAARQIRQSYINAGWSAFLVICLVLLIDMLESGPKWVALLAPLIVVVFAMVSESSLDPWENARWLLTLYVVMALAVGAVFDGANVRNLLLALTPPVVGLGMMFGAMGWLGVDLNPANIIVLPLILGIGVDNGVYVLHDFRKQTGPYRTSPSTMNAIILTSLTSMSGFGSLLVASHRGLASLGQVLVIGLSTCLFVSLVTLPAVLTGLAGGRAEEPDPASSEVPRQAGPDAPQNPPADERAGPEHGPLHRQDQRPATPVPVRHAA